MKTVYMFMVLVVGQYTYAMEGSRVIVAAWVETPETQLKEFDQIIVTKNPNDTFSIKHFSKPNGFKETQCKQKAVIEMPSVFEGIVHGLGVQRSVNDLGDGELALIESVSPRWFTHPYATHGIAVLATVLVMKALSL